MSINIFQLVRDYVTRMLPEDGSMKVLLVDESTLDIISVAFSQTDLLRQGVFLVDQISNTHKRNAMPTMRCVCFVRPSSIDQLCEEVKEAKYQSYTINFSNAATAENLDQLAKSDVKDCIIRVEEYFADFIAINKDCFLIPFKENSLTSMAVHNASDMRRVAEGLAASFVATRRKPYIRFNNRSFLCKRVVAELTPILKSDLELYDYRSKETLLLILDRNEDPITPLLTPWTYQAMLHELVGLDKNRLYLPDAPPEDAAGYVFSQKDDDFFAKNMYRNWGELCQNVKTYVDHCKQVLNIDRSTATIEEVKQFMQRLPQTKSLTGSVTKHATVVSYIAGLIKDRKLLEVSQLEQDMVMNVNQSEHWAKLQELITKEVAVGVDAARLCFIFNLRYEKGASPSRTDSLLSDPLQQRVMLKLREYYGTDKSTDPLFAVSGSSVLSSVVSFVKGLNDVRNIYTQHNPVLKKTVIAAGQGKLDYEQYPYCLTAGPQTFKPKEIIIFMCGGYTFEEAALVNSINNGWKTADDNAPTTVAASSGATYPDVKVLLGGTGIHNSTSFLKALEQLP